MTSSVRPAKWSRRDSPWLSLNSEDRLVQKTFAAHLHEVLGWDSGSRFPKKGRSPTPSTGFNHRFAQLSAAVNGEGVSNVALFRCGNN